MVVRLNNLSKWRKLEPGKTLELPGPEHRDRKVRVEFNTSQPAHIEALMGADAKEGTFVAVVNGYEEIWISGRGHITLAITCDAPVWYYTPESENMAIDLQQQSFTNLGARRQFSDIERIAYQLHQNQVLFQQSMAAEMARIAAANTPHDPVTGEVEEEGQDDVKDDAVNVEGDNPSVVGDGGGGDPVQPSQARPAAASRKAAKGVQADGDA